MSITATELKSNLGKYLLLAATEDIYITKNGKVVAKLSNPHQDRVDIAKSLFGILPADVTLEEAKDLTHRQTHSDKATRDVLTKLCALFGLLDTTALDIRKAISAEISDFEDAVMVETAVRSGADCIVTRNTKDYSKAPIPVYAPAEFIELLTETSEDQTD